MLKIAAALLAPLALMTTAQMAHAQAQPFKAVEAPKTWTLDVGAGPVYGFSPSGKDPNQVRITAWGSFNYKNRLYANGLDGLGYNAILRDKVRAGFQLRPRYAGQSTVEGLVLPERGWDAATYAYVRVLDNVSIGGRIGQDISGQSEGSAWQVSASRQDITKVGLLQSLAYLRGGNKKTNQAFFGIDPEESSATGIAPYNLGGGVQNVGVVFLMMTPIKQYGIGTFVNAEKALGDVADSPLIQARENKDMAYRWGIVVVRRFHSDN
jgi:MipA family protein